MLSFGAISEFAISEIPALPFGGFASVRSDALGTPALQRVSSGASTITATAFGTLRVFVVASGSAGVDVSAAGRPNFVIYASTREFISRPDDQVANQPFYGTLEQSIQFDRSIINSNGFGDVTLGWGEATLINSDGAYDQVIRQYAADGRRVVLKIGDERRIAAQGYNSFFTVFDGMATGIHVEEDVMRVFLRDSTYRLEVPAQPSLYAGTGGLEGTEDLKGKRKPKAYGYCANVTPALVSPTLLLFQVHDGSVQAISAVYSRGNAITFDQNYANAAALMAATVPSGRYATCRAAGLFRVNFNLEGEITADVEGDNTGGFVATSATVIRRALGAANVVTSDLDIASFSSTEAVQPALIGYYLGTDSDATVADLVADIMRGIGGWGGFRRDGRFELGLFRAPTGVPSARYSKVEIVDIKREQLPAGISPQPYRYRVAWGRNFTTQTDTADVISASRVAFLKEQYRLAEVSDNSIRIDHPLAQDPVPIESFFRDETDAAAEAERLLELYGRSANSLYRFVIKARPFVHEIGDQVWVDYPRWDLENGRLLRIVAISERLESNEVELMGFG